MIIQMFKSKFGYVGHKSDFFSCLNNGVVVNGKFSSSSKQLGVAVVAPSGEKSHS